MTARLSSGGYPKKTVKGYKGSMRKIASYATQRSRAFIIKEAVEAYVDKHRAYLAAIDAAIVEADKGVFVSGDKVFAWLEELGTNPNAPRPTA